MQRKLKSAGFLVFVGLGLALGLVFALTVLFSRIPSEDLTRTNMIGIAGQIREYVKTYKELPSDLSQLPTRKGYGNSTKDGWGNEIKYGIADDEIVILTSFGKDGKLGGEGRQADIIGYFNPRIENDYPFIHSLAGANLTRCRMILIKQSLREYTETNKHLPNDLSWLSKQTRYENDIIKDEWGNTIKYRVVNGEVVTLTSLGKDGKLGGAKEDTDIELSFNTKVGRE